LTRTRVKVCGITSIVDAEFCVEAGVDAIGVNLIPSSPRCVTHDLVREIVRSVQPRTLVVAVVADLSAHDLIALRASTGVGCLQLHGNESPATLDALLPHAYKAIRVREASDVVTASAFRGDYLLVDAKVDGVLGGTGVCVDPTLVVDLALRRRLTLAGGLDPLNVAHAIRVVRPYCVDVASGVELRGAPRKKDPSRVLDFVAAVRDADASITTLT
jgi:phosphoribosylanthranilate isomerase